MQRAALTALLLALVAAAAAADKSVLRTAGYAAAPPVHAPRVCSSAHGAGSAACDTASGASCTAPASAKFSAVVVGPQPAMQWDISGGFCGAFSVQQSALGVGAWISQDLVRKANIEQPGPHAMHGNTSAACAQSELGCGWEVRNLLQLCLLETFEWFLLLSDS